MFYPLIDGDIIVYMIGFKADRKRYHLDGKSWQYKAQVDAYCKRNGLNPQDIEVLSNPVDSGTVMKMVDSFIVTLLETLTGIPETGLQFRIFLSGKKNFRDEVAKSYPYKGTRIVAKPTHYELIRTHLVDKWGAIIVEGFEADDALSVVQTCSGSCETVICSTDKDLDQIAGFHYNWMKDDLYEVSKLDGLRFFWRQMLTGDASDNIKGIYGIGPKKADKILDSALESKLPKETDEEAWERVVVNTYVKYFGKTDAGWLRDPTRNIIWGEDNVVLPPGDRGNAVKPPLESTSIRLGRGRLEENRALLWMIRSRGRAKELCENWDDDWIIQ
jgi:hypothetical protein